MADIADPKIQQLLRTIIREETRGIIRDETRAIVREETQTIFEDVKFLRQVQGQQSIMLRTLTTDVSQIKEAVRAQGVFYEKLENHFTALAENVSENLSLSKQVRDHETRLRHLETL